MTHWFEEMTKLLADGTLSRRQALKSMAGMIAWTMFATSLPGSTFATKAHACNNPGTCSNPHYPQCGHNINHYCNCYTRLDNGKGVCGCGPFCACQNAIPPCFCSKQSDCPKGYTCVTQTGCGCSTDVCVQNCARTCRPPLGGSGRTTVSV